MAGADGEGNETAPAGAPSDEPVVPASADRGRHPARSRPARRPRKVGSLAGYDEPEPLHSLVRSWPWAGWLVAAILVLRLVAVAGMRLYLYVDSGEYDRIDFSGDWRRPWATPYLYWLIPGTNRALVVGQALVGAVCWATLALSAAAWFRFRATRIAIAAVLAALGCTTLITTWDAAKLSESLGLSLTVLVIAAWLNFVRRTEVGTAVLVALATLPWLFVRQSLIPTAWLVVALAALTAVVAWRRRGAADLAVRIVAALCLVLALETALATVTYSHNQEIVQENLRVVISNRVAPDPARLAWFEDHGMPVPPSGQFDPDTLRDDPAFSRWVAGEGRSTYLRYLLTHPWYTATAPLDDFAALQRATADESGQPDTAMLSPSAHYATTRPVLPSVAEDLLFGPDDTGAVIFLLVVVAGWSLARSRSCSARWSIPWAIVALAIASLYTGWHGATPELARLALMGAVMLRIGLVLQLAVLIEAEVVHRRRPVVGAEPVTS